MHPPTFTFLLCPPSIFLLTSFSVVWNDGNRSQATLNGRSRERFQEWLWVFGRTPDSNEAAPPPPFSCQSSIKKESDKTDGLCKIQSFRTKCENAGFNRKSKNQGDLKLKDKRKKNQLIDTNTEMTKMLKSSDRDIKAVL